MPYVFSLLLLLVLSVPAGAQSAGPPAFVVGDSWTMSSGFVQRVIKAEGDVTVMKGMGNCPTCLVYVDKNLALLKVEQADGTPPDSVAIGFVPVGTDWKLVDFPLETGKKWNFGAKGLFRNLVNHYDVGNTVQAYEDVSTKAGTFQAFKIARDWTIRPRDNRARGFSWSTTDWYAPSIKRIVKFTTTNPNQQDWELVSYTVK